MGGITPNLKIPYPVGTDRVADGDNAMQAIAERLEARLPYGCLARVIRTTSAGPYQAETQVMTLPSITFPAGRLVRIAAYIADMVGTSATQFGIVYLRANGSRLTQGVRTVVNTGGNTLYTELIFAPGPGALTFDATVACVGGSVNANAGPAYPMYLLCEDIGPATIT